MARGASDELAATLAPGEAMLGRAWLALQRGYAAAAWRNMIARSTPRPLRSRRRRAARPKKTPKAAA